jgi:hypothetical protein
LSAIAVPAEQAPAHPVLEAVEQAVLSPLEISTSEMYRWMLWFGLPVLAAATFVGLSFATATAWLIGPAIGFLLVDIFVLVWLCMSSDTNGLVGEPPSH